MKLATFEVKTLLGRCRRLGLVQEQASALIDLNAAYAWLRTDRGESLNAQRWADFLVPPDMREFLEMDAPAMAAAREVLAACERLGSETLQSLLSPEGGQLYYPMASVSLKTPVSNPRMFRDFLSFEVHTANGFKRRNEPIPEPWYRLPVYYKGNPNTLIGHEEPVHWPGYTEKFDYELEMACIIGKPGRDIPVEEASSYIAGYAVMNDFSARDIQRDEMMCRLGPAKGKDFATAVGPWLVTADEVPDPRNLRMTARINGELWSDGNSGTSHWTFEQMIAHVSRDENIYPGDILGSGTVGWGCGLELDRFLNPGDVTELEIAGLGLLRNTVVRP